METAGFVKKEKLAKTKTQSWTQYQDEADMKGFEKYPNSSQYQGRMKKYPMLEPGRYV